MINYDQCTLSHRGCVSMLIDFNRLSLLLSSPQVAMATLLLNLSVFAHLHCKSDNLLSVLPALRGLPGLCTRMVVSLLTFCGTEPGSVTRCGPEVPLRLLSALGTAIITSVPPKEGDEANQAARLQRVRLIGSAAATSAEEDVMAGWDRFRDVLVFWAEAAAAQLEARSCAAALLQCLEQ